MTDIVFMDTETLGLHPDAPIWEFAAIRRTPEGRETAYHFFIDHYPLPWYDSLPEQFQQDYRDRYRPSEALTRWQAANQFIEATSGAHVVGAVPSFDALRLSKLLNQTGALMPPGADDPWHYHLVDVENVIVGYLVGVGKQAVNDGRLPELDLTLIAPPWSSDELSSAVGIPADEFDRHTAMGDVLWVKAQWDAVMGGPRV
ncbi:MAG: hypothetical protein AB1925_12710 [Actinomycetota bacterium]